MTAIKQEDLIQSVADAFQYISYYHPLDYIKALGEAYEREESPAAKDAIAQILTNSRMSAEGHRPICQDTGIGMVFLKVGMDVQWPDATMSLQEMVNEGVKRAYNDVDNPLRASVLADPAGTRTALPAPLTPTRPPSVSSRVTSASAPRRNCVPRTTACAEGVSMRRCWFSRCSGFASTAVCPRWSRMRVSAMRPPA